MIGRPKMGLWPAGCVMVVLADRYELGEPLGSGGMAQVNAAYDRVLDRRVAVKLIHGHKLDDPVGRERFHREARAAARLSHPNTVGVYDFGEEAGRPFIVMELVEGPSLADRLRDEGRLPVEEVVRLGAAVLSGLDAAHRRGLVHRDVKPSNILLPDGGVKLADFGIATALAETATKLTGTGELVGTPRYMAPECAAGKQATQASDLYSLAVVLYECLAGRAPFEAETAVAMAVAHQREPVPPLASTAPQVFAPVAAVVEQGLAKEPTARFGDAEAMRRALENATVPDPPHDPGPKARSTTATGRRRIFLVASVWAVAVVALGGFLIARGGFGDQETGIFDLEVGDCVLEIPEPTEVISVEVAPCSDEHSGEVFASVRMPDGDDYPGGDAVEDFGRRECTGEFVSYVGLAPEPSELELRFFAPSESAWEGGRREIVCLAVDPDAAVTGTLENADR